MYHDFPVFVPTPCFCICFGLHSFVLPLDYHPQLCLCCNPTIFSAPPKSGISVNPCSPLILVVHCMLLGAVVIGFFWFVFCFVYSCPHGNSNLLVFTTHLRDSLKIFPDMGPGTSGASGNADALEGSC